MAPIFADVVNDMVYLHPKTTSNTGTTVEQAVKHHCRICFWGPKILAHKGEATAQKAINEIVVGGVQVLDFGQLNGSSPKKPST